MTRNKRFISFWCWVAAIIITLALCFLGSHFGILSILIFASMVWAGIDARRIKLWHYSTGISCRPGTLVLLLVLAWFLIFPWYVGMRLKIMAGTAKLRHEYEPWQMSDPTFSSNGLLQPWKGRKILSD